MTPRSNERKPLPRTLRELGPDATQQIANWGRPLSEPEMSERVAPPTSPMESMMGQWRLNEPPSVLRDPSWRPSVLRRTETPPLMDEANEPDSHVQHNLSVSPMDPFGFDLSGWERMESDMPLPSSGHQFYHAGAGVTPPNALIYSPSPQTVSETSFPDYTETYSDDTDTSMFQRDFYSNAGQPEAPIFGQDFTFPIGGAAQQPMWDAVASSNHANPPNWQTQSAFQQYYTTLPQLGPCDQHLSAVSYNPHNVPILNRPHLPYDDLPSHAYDQHSISAPPHTPVFRGRRARSEGITRLAAKMHHADAVRLPRASRWSPYPQRGRPRPATAALAAQYPFSGPSSAQFPSSTHMLLPQGIGARGDGFAHSAPTSPWGMMSEVEPLCEVPAVQPGMHPADVRAGEGLWAASSLEFLQFRRDGDGTGAPDADVLPNVYGWTARGALGLEFAQDSAPGLEAEAVEDIQ